MQTHIHPKAAHISGRSHVIRRLPAGALLIAFIALNAATTALADSIDINASARGWVISFGNNGASSTNDYFAGNDGIEGFRNWFEFTIPMLSGGPVTSATLDLAEPDLGHEGGALTYSVYGLSGQPLVFSDVTTNDPFGSIVTTESYEGTILTITLDAAALAAIQADQGGDLFIGGLDSGENGSGFDFDNSSNASTSLELTTGAEPTTAFLLLAGLVPLLIGVCRVRRAWHS